MAGISKAYATIAEGQIHLRRVDATGDQPPLVLLHASPASSLVLEPLLRELAGKCELIAFDNPCNGQSCAPVLSEPEIDDFADMLDRACDALGLDQINLYGTHTGAHIAIAWALARPERVKSLVLDGVALFSQELRDEMIEQYAPPKSPDESGSQFHWAWQYMRDQMIFFPHYRKDADHKRAGGSFDAETLHRLTLDILNNLETYHLPYLAVFRHNARADLARLKLPVLVLTGEAGPLDPASAEIMELVPEAKLAQGCSTPQTKAAAISEFLEAQ